MDGTLADPHSVPSCPVCDGKDPCCTMHQFPDTIHPSDYPFLPDEGGFDRNAESGVEVREMKGARKVKGMRCRS